MRPSPRLIVLAALGVSPAFLLTSCADDASGARTTLGTVQTTSYVVEPPITTTTTTTLPAGPSDGSQTSPNEQSYTVVAGDSVYGIARKHGITPEALANYNDWPEGIAHTLLPGDVVRIPPNSQVPSAGGSDTGGTGTSATPDDGSGSAPPETEPSGTGCTHTIVAGDNPTRVANKYDITVDELSNANVGNPAYQNFLIGSQLSIPANGNCP